MQESKSKKNTYRWAEHVSGAEWREFWNFRSPLTWAFAPSLKVIPDSSVQWQLSAHLKSHSAPVKSLHTRSNLKEGAIPTWPVCLLFKIFYKLYLLMNDFWYRLTLEGTRECGLVHALDSWRAVLEQNLSETEPSLRPLDYSPLCAPTIFCMLPPLSLRSAHVPCHWEIGDIQGNTGNITRTQTPLFSKKLWFSSILKIDNNE